LLGQGKNMSKIFQLVQNTSAAALMYVYAYSWTPGFCYNQNYPGCLAPQDYWKNNFTIHGLWPQYTSGDGYPSYCDSEAFDLDVIDEIGWTEMTEKWPNVQSNPNDTDYDSFWEHEWDKHGTCIQLSQFDYFDAALNLSEIIATPSVMQEAIGQNMSADELRTALDNGITDSAVLQCDKTQDGAYVLTGAYTCWDQLEGFPTNQVACPDEVVKEDTCFSDTVLIPAL